MDKLFHDMVARGASDLHMTVSRPPMIRKDGVMIPMDESLPRLEPDEIRGLLTSIMPQKNREEFDRRHDTDFAYEIMGLARFRANIFMDRKGWGGVFRVIPNEILTAEKLGLSQAEFAERFQIPIGTLRDWEQHRTEPDQAALSYLKVIEADADFVARAVAA